MPKYCAVFMGSLSAAQLTVDRDFLHDHDAKQWLSRQLPNYWPIYYNAAIYNVDDDAESKLVVNYVSQVTVKAV